MTPDEVADRLLEMGQTLRRLYVRGCWPAGYRSIMPEPIRTQDELFGAVRQRIGELEEQYRTLGLRISQERLIREAYDAEKPYPDPPTAAEITKMDEAIQWIGHIVHPRPKIERKRRGVVWARAKGFRFSKIGRACGLTREGARQHWVAACEQIARACQNRQDLPFFRAA